MFCPNCGQQQTSEQTRFCSRCGLPLGLISQVVAYGGSLPQLNELYQNKSLWTRRNGLIFSLFWFLLFVFILTPLFGILDVESLAGMSAVLGVMGGLILVLASFIFLKKPDNFPEYLNGVQANDVSNLTGNNFSALPPQQTQPAQSYAPPVVSWKTSDDDNLLRQGSVTEGTTKLLEKEEEL